MEFLKAILGEELFKQFADKLNAYNGDEADKDKQIKLANLGGGEYVGKGKYDALQALLDGKTAELDTANGLIADLKKALRAMKNFRARSQATKGRFSSFRSSFRRRKSSLQSKWRFCPKRRLMWITCLSSWKTR